MKKSKIIAWLLRNRKTMIYATRRKIRVQFHKLQQWSFENNVLEINSDKIMIHNAVVKNNQLIINI